MKCYRTAKLLRFSSVIYDPINDLARTYPNFLMRVVSKLFIAETLPFIVQKAVSTMLCPSFEVTSFAFLKHMQLV